MSMSINSANSAIGSSKYYEEIREKQQMASGKSINTAADNASGLAIMEKLEAQINGLDQGSENTATMQDALTTAEGGLSGINDGLQRIRELAVQASNGTLSDSDKEMIQTEVDQIKDEIKSATEKTEFNTMKLLDGSFADKNTASSPDGTGAQITIENTSLATLGIEDFDVTGDFDIADIDAAIESVSTAASKIGASINTMDYTISSNENTLINLETAQSKVGDADMARATADASSASARQQAEILMQKDLMEQQMQTSALLR